MSNGSPGTVRPPGATTPTTQDLDTDTTSEAEREAARLPAEAERAEAEKRKRRVVITLNKLGAAAITVRREFVTAMVARRTLPKGAATFVADCLARDSYLLTHHHADTTASS